MDHEKEIKGLNKLFADFCFMLLMIQDCHLPVVLSWGGGSLTLAVLSWGGGSLSLTLAVLSWGGGSLSLTLAVLSWGGGSLSLTLAVLSRSYTGSGS